MMIKIFGISFGLFLATPVLCADGLEQVFDTQAIMDRSKSCDIELGPTVIKAPRRDICSYLLRCDYDRSVTFTKSVVTSDDGSCPADPRAALKVKGRKVVRDVSVNGEDLVEKKEAVSGNVTCHYETFPASAYAPLPQKQWDEYCESVAVCNGERLFLYCPYDHKVKKGTGEIFKCLSVSECYAKRFATEAPKTPASTAGRRSKVEPVNASTGISGVSHTTPAKR